MRWASIAKAPTWLARKRALRNWLSCGHATVPRVGSPHGLSVLERIQTPTVAATGTTGNGFMSLDVVYGETRNRAIALQLAAELGKTVSAR
jgi:hypothetical protein